MRILVEVGAPGIVRLRLRQALRAHHCGAGECAGGTDALTLGSDSGKDCSLASQCARICVPRLEELTMAERIDTGFVTPTDNESLFGDVAGLIDGRSP